MVYLASLDGVFGILDDIFIILDGVFCVLYGVFGILDCVYIYVFILDGIFGNWYFVYFVSVTRATSPHLFVRYL